MKRIKSGLYALLGQRAYLRLVHLVFRLAYRSGWLRRDSNYAFHYFVSRLVKRGDYVIDIGANLGYFSMVFADLIGQEGRLWSVEPVPVYRQILMQFLGRRSNVEILPYALGDQPGEVQMGVPGKHPYRHGLTRILTGEEAMVTDHVFRVEVRTPGDLFGRLSRLDYVKCDVEGYESHILPLMFDLFQRFRPLVQVELARENRAAIFSLFSGLEYQAYALAGQTLHALADAGAPAAGDVLFIPREKVSSVKELIPGR